MSLDSKGLRWKDLDYVGPRLPCITKWFIIHVRLIDFVGVKMKHPKHTKNHEHRGTQPHLPTNQPHPGRASGRIRVRS